MGRWYRRQRRNVQPLGQTAEDRRTVTVAAVQKIEQDRAAGTHKPVQTTIRF